MHKYSGMDFVREYSGENLKNEAEISRMKREFEERGGNFVNEAEN